MATFVIAEDEFWQPGLDLAAALRQRGQFVVRLTAEPEPARSGGLRRWSKVPNTTVVAAITPQGVPSARGLEVLTELAPVDWQAAESILNWLSQNGFEDALGFRRSEHLPVHAVQDKRLLSEYLGTQGLSVPRTWSDVDAIGDVPGPFMFKLRDQGGGEGIHRCEDLSELRAWATTYEPLPYIVQRFHAGTPVIAAGVAREGAVVQMMTYVSVLNPRTPFRMAYGLRVVDAPEVYAYAARVLEVLGITGPFALDTVPGDDGEPLAVDMNLRIWGSWTACQAAGMDVIGSYLYAMGQGAHPGPVSQGAREAAILRRPPLGVRSVPERLRWVTSEAAEIRRRERWLGPRWARCSLRDAVGWTIRGAALDS
ncbi:MAG TPA: hypothetical protein PKH30_02550 [Actinomycetota bacterium]|nr:hypothetical protein [Actinomycetota bacterium]HNO15007.1 hypothetical protein [Actinomycetota bacterium]